MLRLLLLLDAACYSRHLLKKVAQQRNHSPDESRVTRVAERCACAISCTKSSLTLNWNVILTFTINTRRNAERNVMLSSCAAFLFVGIGITLAGYTRFLDWNEQRAGKVRLNDPILKRLPSPFDASIAVFTVLYSNLALAVYAHLCNGTLCDLLEQQFLVILCRIPAMYMLPLQAPCTVVPLSDPLTTRSDGVGLVFNQTTQQPRCALPPGMTKAPAKSCQPI
jgi:hypothetical protein